LLVETELKVLNQAKINEARLVIKPEFGIIEVMEQLNNFFSTFKSVNRLSEREDGRIRLKVAI
jgi:hypothetical protein